MLPRLALTFALAVFLCPGGAAGQTQPPAPSPTEAEYDAPAYIAVIDGTATLERDGRIESSPLNMPLVSGDRLRTTDGRLEVRFADGARLHMDLRTRLDVLSDELVRLVDGRLRVSVPRGAEQVSYRIDSAAGSVRIAQPGEYRVSLLTGPSTELRAGAQDTQLELAVVRGGGEIFTEEGTTAVRAGERAYASAGHAPSYAYTYNSANMDAFDRWSDGQRETYATASGSSQYLPTDMREYSSTFDQYGDWRYQQDYGYVWYPRVATEWRPYYYGRWASYPRYGWTWIAADRFGWPTHHYGRWGFSANAWFWIPSSRWAPAYVSWGYATDYVSWCPLGWNNRAVISLNFFGGSSYYYGGPRYYSAWTIVPRGSFGRGYAYERAVGGDHFRNVRPRFTEGRTAPAYDSAIPRRAQPIRYAGSRASSNDGRLAGARSLPAEAGSARSGSRSETPRYINRGDQIVRSQTGRPVSPRDVTPRDTGSRAIPRPSVGAPDSSTPRRAEVQSPGGPYSTSSARRPSADASGAPSRAVGREPRAWDNPGYRPPPQSRDAAPRAYERPAPQAAPRSYERPAPESAPRAYERPAPQSAPRAYERPTPQGAPRAYERPTPQAEPRGYDRAVPREAPQPPRSYERPAERSAPPPPRSGGERAAPRSAPAGPAGGTAAPRRGGRGR